MEWFVQLHKKICDWEWYTDIPTKTLFLHVLLKCNYKEAKWRGIDVNPWDFITSLDHLSSETWLSVRQVRTALEHLEKTWEVTKKSTSMYTILTLNNWASYNTPDDKPSTNKWQTKDKPSTTTNKEYKEYKEYKENNITISKDIGEQAIDSVEENKEYWNKEINKTLLFLQKHIGCDTFSESQKLQRQYAKHILNLWKQIGSEEMKHRLDEILSDKFKAKNANKLAYIYKELKSFIRAPEKEIAKF